MKTKTPRPMPSIISCKDQVWKDYHIPLGEFHWLRISNQAGSVLIEFRDESDETKDILSFDLHKDSTAYAAIIEALTEFKDENKTE